MQQTIAYELSVCASGYTYSVSSAK